MASVIVVLVPSPWRGGPAADRLQATKVRRLKTAESFGFTSVVLRNGRRVDSRAREKRTSRALDLLIIQSYIGTQRYRSREFARPMKWRPVAAGPIVAPQRNKRRRA